MPPLPPHLAQILPRVTPKNLGGVGDVTARNRSNLSKSEIIIIAVVSSVVFILLVAGYIFYRSMQKRKRQLAQEARNQKVLREALVPGLSAPVSPVTPTYMRDPRDRDSGMEGMGSSWEKQQVSGRNEGGGERRSKRFSWSR